MEELKQLTLDYREFITNVIITEEELYCNYRARIDSYIKGRLIEDNKIIEYVEKTILADILYDLVFNKNKIKQDLINATEFFYEEYSKQETLNIYKKIKQVMKDFTVEQLESEI